MNKQKIALMLIFIKDDHVNHGELLMEPFFELRIYEVYPNKMSEWIEFMDKKLFPFKEKEEWK